MIDMNSSTQKIWNIILQFFVENEYVLSKTRPQNFIFLQLLSTTRSSLKKKTAKPGIYYQNPLFYTQNFVTLRSIDIQRLSMVHFSYTPREN